MVSPELLRRHTFFSGFTFDQLDILAMAAEEMTVPAKHWFFHEGEKLDQFFFLLSGSVMLTYNIPDPNKHQTTAMQLTGNMITKPISIGTLGEQEMFGWSALIPPNVSTAGAKAATDCRTINFSMAKLRLAIEDNCCFGHLLTLKTAQTVRERLRMRRIESLVDYAQKA